jgi:hypothetical protein
LSKSSWLMVAVPAQMLSLGAQAIADLEHA